MNETDISFLCRLCLNKSFFYSNIYVGQSSDNNPFYEDINYVYDLHISVEDGLPEFICQKCRATVKEFKLYKTNAHIAKMQLVYLKQKMNYVTNAEEVAGGKFPEEEDRDQASNSDAKVRIKQEPEEFEECCFEEEIPNEENEVISDAQLDAVTVKEEPLVNDTSCSPEDGDTVSMGLQTEKAKIGPIRLKEEFGIFETEKQESDGASDDGLVTEKLVSSIRKDDEEITENSKFQVFAECIVAEKSGADDGRGDCEESVADCHYEIRKRPVKMEFEKGNIHSKYQMTATPVKMEFEEDYTYSKEQANEAIATSPETGLEAGRVLKSERVSEEVDTQTHQSWRREEGVPESSGNGRGKRKLKVPVELYSSGNWEVAQIPTKCVRKETERVGNWETITGGRNVDEKGYKSKSLVKDTESVDEKKRPHVCQYCKKGFYTRNTLVTHVKIHTGRYAYECKVCKKRYGSHYALRRHLSTHEVHVCNICNKEFPKKFALDRHQVIHTGNKPYVCNLCHRSFSFEGALKRHSLIHAGEKTHKCHICSIKFHTRFELHQHCRTHDGDVLGDAKEPTKEDCPAEMQGRYQCESCHKLFLYESILSLHKLTHGTEGRFVCDVCHKVISNKIVFERHVSGHVEKRFEHKCRFCGKQYRFRYLLKNHEFFHEEKRSHVCSFCKKAFSTRLCLNRHLLIHTGKSTHSCKICNKRFWHEFTLMSHLRCHDVHRCNVCKKEFRKKFSLQQHQLIHSGDKPHVCEYCQKSFGLKHYLNSHVLIHVGKKTHECQHCGKKFLRNTELVRHSRTHDKEKQFQCRFCDKKYRRKVGLRDHEKRHTNPKPFQCPLCTRSFANRTGLHRHKLRHGKRKEMPCTDETSEKTLEQS